VVFSGFPLQKASSEARIVLLGGARGSKFSGKSSTIGNAAAAGATLMADIVGIAPFTSF